MRVVLQRVSEASVHVDKILQGKIDKGFLLLVGITHDDTPEIINKMAMKIAGLRVFEDENEKMNLCLKEVEGKILSISQFTLYADTRRGRRPSFTDSAKPDLARPLYDLFNEELRKLDIEVETSIFGADMKVNLLNDGPVTIILDSEEMR